MTDEPPTSEAGRIGLPLRRRQGAIAEAVRCLDGAGVAIEDIAMRRPTLDDVFISLTLRAAEADEPTEAEEAVA